MAAFKLKTKHGKFVIDLNKVTAVRFATDGSIHILIDSQKLRFEIENIEKAMKAYDILSDAVISNSYIEEVQRKLSEDALKPVNEMYCVTL